MSFCCHDFSSSYLKPWTLSNGLAGIQCQRWTRVIFLNPDPTRPTNVRPVTRPDQTKNCLQFDLRHDPTRLHANAMRYITDCIFTIKNSAVRNTEHEYLRKSNSFATFYSSKNNKKPSHRKDSRPYWLSVTFNVIQGQ